MAKIAVKNLEGKKVGDVELDETVFGAHVNRHLIWEAVKAQMASRRAGTHSTKRRDEVRGGGKKPYKQKGTGNARQGSLRAPHYVGGGSVFGPKPRDYSYQLPKKALVGALRSAVALRFQEEKLIVVDEWVLKTPKTQKVAGALTALNANNALIVDATNESLAKSARNLPKTKYLSAARLNVVDLIQYETLVVTKAGLDAVVARLQQKEAV